MEKENRKGLIYEFPMGVAVLKGGNSLQIDIANAEFMKAIGHGEQAEPDRNRDFYDCVYLQDAGAFEDMIEKCREQKRAEEIEVRIISGQGQICWVKFWCSIYYYKDAVPYYLLICKNTNDRKELPYQCAHQQIDRIFSQEGFGQTLPSESVVHFVKDSFLSSTQVVEFYDKIGRAHV